MTHGPTGSAKRDTGLSVVGTFKIIMALLSIFVKIFLLFHLKQNKKRMEASENLLGHRTNTLALQRLQCYQGCAIIKLQYLRYKEYNLTGTREIAEKNVEKLFRIFEIEGCGNLEPKHRVTATINQEVLRKALTKSNLTLEALIDLKNQPNLLLEGEDIITCIYRKYCLKAGERFGETM